jgi:archaellum component FlaF (FlaF/FlaG flagellin family)
VADVERYTLILLAILLTGCLGGSITEQEALQTVQATDSYQSLGSDIQTTTWEINESTLPSGDPNLTRLMDASERERVIYGLEEFSSIDVRPGYIIRATGTEGGLYYHLGTDGTVHGSVSMRELSRNITSRLRQEVDAIRDEIERQQSCSAIDLEITEAGYDSQTSEAYVVAQHTGTATIETLTITFLGDTTSMDTRERTEIVPGDVISAVFDTTEPPTTVRLTVPGCPEEGIQQPLQ